jgi:hypothetical protein
MEMTLSRASEGELNREDAVIRRLLLKKKDGITANIGNIKNNDCRTMFITHHDR